ncbi:hypothetical protein HMPREF3156_01767 [Neisseria sp. HMSC06F02]|nr:hypothetical protein HMPREF3156_01767 [Neisseria sp. HMSC06F02]
MFLIMPYFNSKGRLKRGSDDLYCFLLCLGFIRQAEAEERMRL